MQTWLWLPLGWLIIGNRRSMGFAAHCGRKMRLGGNAVNALDNKGFSAGRGRGSRARLAAASTAGTLRTPPPSGNGYFPAPLAGPSQASLAAAVSSRQFISIQPLENTAHQYWRAKIPPRQWQRVAIARRATLSRRVNCLYIYGEKPWGRFSAHGIHNACRIGRRLMPLEAPLHYHHGGQPKQDV